MSSPHIYRSASSAVAGNGYRAQQPRNRVDRSQEHILAALSDVVTVSPPPERAHFGHASVPSQTDAASYAGANPMAPYEPPTSLPGTSMVPGEDPLALNRPPPVPSAAEKPSQPAQAPQPPQKAGMANKFANAFRRQTAEEKAAKRNERQRRANGEMGRSKTVTGSSRMDVIDKLDLSGIHGSSMFHHDSPYDACTPHANRSSKKAPVRAFDPNIDPMTGLPKGQARDGSSRRNPSPLAPSMQKLDINDSAPVGQPRATRSHTSPMVPSLPMTGNDPSTSAVNLPGANDNGSLADTASHSTDTSDMDERYRASRGATSSNPPAGNAVADMWGHVAEPWQDFAAPKAKAKKSRSGQGNPNASPGMLSPYSRNGSRDGVSSAASSVFDMEAVMTGKSAEEKRRAAAGASPSEELAGVSPFPEPDYDRAGGGTDSNAPKRSKSLIKRIKSARQYPNVPPPDDDVLEMQGRNVSRRNRANTHKHSPSSPATGDWGGLTSPNLGVGGGSLGRSGTRKATAEEQSRYNNRAVSGNNGSTSNSSNGMGTPATGGEPDYFEASNNQYLSASADERPGRSPTEGPSGGGLGRSGSIFGRFSRKKSTERGLVQ